MQVQQGGRSTQMLRQYRSARERGIDLIIAALVTPLALVGFYGAQTTVASVVLVTGLFLMLDTVCGPPMQWRMSPPALSAPAGWQAALATVSPPLLLLLGVYGLQILLYGAAATPRRALGLPLVLYGLMVLRHTWRESTLEVSLDFTISILINLGGQRLIYGALATTEAMATFTSVFLPLAYGRRLGTRLGFHWLSRRWPVQPRWLSALEVTSDTLLALGMAYGLQVYWYGGAATLERAGGLTMGLYAFTMLRRYVFRRIFAAQQARPLTPAALPTPGVVGEGTPDATGSHVPPGNPPHDLPGVPERGAPRGRETPRPSAGEDNR
jgi:hypothetical protein